MKKHDSSNGEVTSYAHTIFQQPWWLNAVAPRDWAEVTVKRGSEIVARMPYTVKKRYGLNYLLMPPLTQNLGPWLRSSKAKYAKKLGQEKKIARELIDKLPSFDLFRQNFSPTVTNWLPFYWAGFKQSTHYTYRLEDLTDLDAIWKGFRANIKTDIRKAKKAVSIRDDLGIDRFLSVYALTFQRQGREQPHSKELVCRLDEACSKREVRKIFFAEDSRGRIHGVLYLIWDQDTAYYLMGGSDPELRNSGAGSLLVWEAIQFAATVTRAFDFEGSMIESIERFFRAFGAKQVPYFHVTKMSRRMSALIACRDFAKAIKGQ
jgi:hypothetical protein